MAAEAENAVNGSIMENTYDDDSHFSNHILKMLEAAASRRSVNIVIVNDDEEAEESAIVTEATKRDVNKVSWPQKSYKWSTCSLSTTNVPNTVMSKF